MAFDVRWCHPDRLSGLAVDEYEIRLVVREVFTVHNKHSSSDTEAKKASYPFHEPRGRSR